MNTTDTATTIVMGEQAPPLGSFRASLGRSVRLRKERLIDQSRWSTVFPWLLQYRLS